MTETLSMFRIRYSAWPDGARISTHGEFDLPARSADDARLACLRRWPEMYAIEINHIEGPDEDAD